MILSICRLFALGALIAVPAASAGATERLPERTDSPYAARAEAPPSRRVELPFPLPSRTPEGAPDTVKAPAPDPPHPFRELELKRAGLALVGPPSSEARRLSRSRDLV